jgi:Ni/Co efflux regulator RcnB
MNKKALIIATMAACLTSGAAFAQSYDRGNQRGDRHEQYERNDRHQQYDRNDRNDKQRGYSNDRNDRNDRYVNSRRDSRHGHVRGAGPRYDMHRGGYLAREYRGSRYVVSDWRGRSLYAPPRGHQWVQTGNDYVLVALATGLIAHVLLNN